MFHCPLNLAQFVRRVMNSDKNLLFGLLAVQLDFILPDELIAAMNSWVLRKSTALGAILQEQGKLSPDRRTLLEALVEEHLKQHGQDGLPALPALAQ